MGKMKVFGKSEIAMLRGLGLIPPEKEWLWLIINYSESEERKSPKEDKAYCLPEIFSARGSNYLPLSREEPRQGPAEWQSLVRGG